MHFKTTKFFLSILCCFSLLLVACNDDTPAQRQTLKSMDTNAQVNAEENKEKKNITKSESDIRDAYINYLRHSDKQDSSRSDALNRLASIEFKLSEQLLINSSDQNSVRELANNKLDRVIELLETSLQDYPKAKHNDKTLYQLAKAYDQKGNYDKTHLALQQLVNNCPKSIYYLEAQFRLAEYAFSAKKYRFAEDKYTEIIIARNKTVFYEKSLYKRGWSRFKQQFYIQATDDFIRVINFNNFQDYDQLNDSDKNLFDEYFRAIALSFSYLGGAEPLKQYFQQTTPIDNLYYIYRSLSDVYLKQQRYNDAAFALNNFVSAYPDSEYSPEAALKVIAIWKESGFVEKRDDAFNHFYSTYQPNSPYWRKQKSINKKRFDHTNRALKALILTETATYHKKYQQSKKEQDFIHAQRWYQNYLKHYQQYAHQDNIYFLFASLYGDHLNNGNAFKHYQLAGFDEQTIINKDAAYQSIILASTLFSESQKQGPKERWLAALINDSTLYAQQYPTDKQTIKIIAHASALAYENKLFTQAISLAELAVDNHKSPLLNDINMIKAQAYFQNEQYATAETTYLALTNNKRLTKKEKSAAQEGLALAIFYQGNIANEKQQVEQAINHYARIIDVAPSASSAAIGLYDAIALSIKHERWLPAIEYIKAFRKTYPDHKKSNDVAKKLSIAYLNSKQDIAAAKELEQLSNKEESLEYKMASLLKAAQLYQENNDNDSAIRSYGKYVANYPKPFPPYLESLHQLANLNIEQKHNKKSIFWQKKILAADKKNPSTLKNGRTNFIASNSAMALARQSNQDFEQVKLIQPLKKNLKRKKLAMQASVNYYAKASSYGIAETATEATYAIATIYNGFSQALLNSEVPNHLSQDEKEQYRYLLEDQAFPFEDKAIEFFEVNLRYTKDDIYDQWIAKSLQQLQYLFPLRYQRQPKLENVINVLH
ncbi:MAG: TolA-binding protein [Oleiphilaceae bacterium]|jgi:TolA-binding protein